MAGTYLRVMCVYDFNPSAGGDQAFVNTYDVLVPGGFGSWGWFAGHVNTLHQTLGGDMPAALQPRELRFYRPEDPLPDGRPLNVTPLLHPFTGSASPMQAPQVCCTVTEITAVRKAWGRIYFPAPTTQHTTSSGTFAAAFIDKLAVGVQTLYESLLDQDVVPVVKTTKSLEYMRLIPLPPVYDDIDVNFFHPVEAVQVDNVPDIQRRRRHVAATYKKRQTITFS